MRAWLRDNGLSVVLFLFFAVFLVAQTLTGLKVYNDDQEEHGGSPITYGEYLRTGHFVEATFENWESEFLQMGAYVLLTTFLVQRGSAESRDPDEPKEPSVDPLLAAAAGPASTAESQPSGSTPPPPGPVRAGGRALLLYRYSLTIALLLLFVMAFVFHALGGAEEYSQEQLEHGGQAVSVWEFVQTSEFWFQSFQNWQSEFLAVLTIVVLSIFLRQDGSPESKSITDPHSKTGTS